MREAREAERSGAVAQLGERVLCKHEVIGSIPFSSTIFFVRSALESAAPEGMSVQATHAVCSPIQETATVADCCERRLWPGAWRRLPLN